MTNALFNDNRLKLGVFGLNVSNGCAATTAEGHLQPTWQNNVDIAVMIDGHSSSCSPPLSSRCLRCLISLYEFRMVSLNCCDELYSILETGVRWYAVGRGPLRAPDTRATRTSSRHDRSGPRPSLGSQGAPDAATQLHGSALELATVLASSCAGTPDGKTLTTTTVVSRTRSGPWRTHSCAVSSVDYSDAVSGCPAQQSWC
jgi:hypothetical protein